MGGLWLPPPWKNLLSLFHILVPWSMMPLLLPSPIYFFGNNSIFPVVDWRWLLPFSVCELWFCQSLSTSQCQCLVVILFFALVLYSEVGPEDEHFCYCCLRYVNCFLYPAVPPFFPYLIEVPHRVLWGIGLNSWVVGGSGMSEPILIAKVTECICFQEIVSLVYYWVLILIINMCVPNHIV